MPVVVGAVERSLRLRGFRATGWPVLGWLGGIKQDPLKRLDLDLGDDGRELSGRSRTALPEATQVQRARVDTEVRTLADDVQRRAHHAVGRVRTPGLRLAPRRAQ